MDHGQPSGSRYEVPACPGYVHKENAELRPPVVVRAGRPVTVDGDGRPTGHLELLESIDGWTCMAVFDEGGRPTVVLEQLTEPIGRIVFMTESGVVKQLSKSLEPTGSDSRRGWYRGRRKEEVLPGSPDVLRDELLADGHDPDPNAVLDCFPPVRKAFFEGHVRPHTFIGTGISSDVIPLFYDDVPMVSRVPVGVVAPGSERAMRDEVLWEGLVGEWYPFVRTVYPTGPDESWEVVTFATVDGADEFVQPVWYRFVKLERGRVSSVRYIDSFLPHPAEGKELGSRFYRSLLHTSRYWDEQFEGGMIIESPAAWIETRSLHALAREVITRHGSHPKYGIADQAYAGAEHDGFQDVLVSSVMAFLEWGYFERARQYLDNYFVRFVRADGTIRYRGPEVGKYGAMLICLGMYYDYTRDHQLLLKHAAKIDAIVQLLLSRWRRARQLDPEDPAFGMIPGYHEADINFLTPNVYELDYDRPYLSNTGQIWRGARDLGQAWVRIGELTGAPELVDKGERLQRDAAEMFGDAQRGVERSWMEKHGERGLPIIAGSSTFYWEHAYRSRPESYDENRVWSELYFSGAATRETVKEIWDAAGKRGHTSLGVFNNRSSMVGFLVWEELYGLLQHDMVPEALLVFYAQAFHAHSRGTWTAIECVDMDRDRGFHSPYCLPAQMTVPIAAKWLLVFEDPITRGISLAQGTPREWLEDGRDFGIRAAPTRYGRVGFHVRSRLGSGVISAEVSLPDRPGARVRLRLRAPSGYTMVAASATAPEGLSLRVEGEYVLFPASARGRVHLTTQWQPRQEAPATA